MSNLKVAAIILALSFLISTSSTAETIDIDWGLASGDVGTITVSVGDIVRWTWADGAAHSVTSPGNFDSGVISGAGTTFSFVADSPGTYDFECVIHASMRGTIVVELEVSSEATSWGTIKARFR